MLIACVWRHVFAWHGPYANREHRLVSLHSLYTHKGNVRDLSLLISGTENKEYLMMIWGLKLILTLVEEFFQSKMGLYILLPLLYTLNRIMHNCSCMCVQLKDLQFNSVFRGYFLHFSCRYWCQSMSLFAPRKSCFTAHGVGIGIGGIQKLLSFRIKI